MWRNTLPVYGHNKGYGTSSVIPVRSISSTRSLSFNTPLITFAFIPPAFNFWLARTAKDSALNISPCDVIPDGPQSDSFTFYSAVTIELYVISLPADWAASRRSLAETPPLPVEPVGVGGGVVEVVEPSLRQVPMELNWLAILRATRPHLWTDERQTDSQYEQRNPV